MHTIEKDLIKKAKRGLKKLRGQRKPRTKDIFDQRYYIVPNDLLLENYFRSKPLTAFNPGAIEKKREFLIFPRIVMGYFVYASSVGILRVDADKAIRGELDKPFKTKIILWPQKLWEFNGCEDPCTSVVDDEIWLLYTGWGKFYKEDKSVNKSVQAFCRLGPSFEPKEKSYFSITDRKRKFIPVMKDSVFLKIMKSKANMLVRPTFGEISLCWKGKANFESSTLEKKTLEPVLGFEKWEHKVGWSTNALPLSKNEYLVGWHGVLKKDLSYRNGLAIVDDEGELLKISDYLLAPKGLKESFGDRPLVIFGRGLIRYKEYLVWIGGISDYGIGIFVTELERALEKLD